MGKLLNVQYLLSPEPAHYTIFWVSRHFFCIAFFWWFIILSDCRHLNLREINHFPVGLEQMSETIKHELADLTDELMIDLKRNVRRKEAYYRTTGRVIYDEFFPKHSKPIMDKIDHVLAQHYGFTDQELDFIINYDIKYRMGLGYFGNGGGR